jgi:Fe-S cluster assembly protein SufD
MAHPDPLIQKYLESLSGMFADEDVRASVLSEILARPEDVVAYRERYKYTRIWEDFSDEYFALAEAESRVSAPRKQVLAGKIYSTAHPAPGASDILAEALTRTDLGQGAEAGPLAELLERHPDMLEAYCSFPESGKDVFADLNRAFATPGIGIYIPQGVRMQQIIRVVRAAGQGEMMRSFVYLGDGSESTLWWEERPEGSLANNVCHAFLGKDARAEWTQTFCSGAQTLFIHHNYVRQLTGSRMQHHVFNVGGRSVRLNHNVSLSGPVASHESHGLCYIGDASVSDVDIRMEHTASDCTSNQLYKQIADGNSLGIFTGRILIPKDSQRTLAYQKSNNIQLDPRSMIRTRPQLEIYADDVKCSHGATVGQLDSEALFYLRSRGIGLQEARRLLLGAFAGEVFNDMEHPALNAAIRQYVGNHVLLLEDIQ